jgi:hypothetical protein
LAPCSCAGHSWHNYYDFLLALCEKGVGLNVLRKTYCIIVFLTEYAIRNTLHIPLSNLKHSTLDLQLL